MCLSEADRQELEEGQLPLEPSDEFFMPDDEGSFDPRLFHPVDESNKATWVI